MSIFSSLYIGMSGMRSNEGAIGVIGDNISNLNTIGYKSSRAVFADLLSHSVLGSAGRSQEGQGVTIAGIQKQMTQGSLLATNVTTDLAIDGDGFFIAADASGARSYTRNGELQMDRDGFLTTIDGLRIQGYPAGDDGTIGTQIGDLELADATSPAKATDGIAMAVNLNPDSPTPQAAAYTTQVTVYDSLGRSHQLDVDFTKQADGSWSWTASSPQSELDGGTDTTPTVVAAGSLTFDTNGKLATETQTQTTVTFNGASAQDLKFDFGEETANGGDGSGSSSNASVSGVNFVDQNGFAPGALQYVEIGSDGTISGTFSNGEQRALGQLALARFTAPEALDAIGNNRYAATRDAGDPAIGAADSGGRGEASSGALEQSNVDLTNEFSNLILAQRGYQAASKTITTADEMLQTLVNIKQ